MKKIAIVGCAGSGKTYLGQQIHKILNLPLYHLDQYYWKPNWTRPDFEDFQLIHNQICDKAEWIIDGTPLKTLFYRFDEADTIIFLDIPIWICFLRVIKRSILNYGKVLSTSAPDCKECFSWGFLKWVWNFKRNTKPNILFLLDCFSDKEIYILKSKRAVNQFLKSIK